MQIDRITIALRPRPARQALDLGFALLQARAAVVYKAWLALWLPLAGIAAVLTWWKPDYAMWFVLLPWWLRPLLERAPLYVLSRQVFGEDVTWGQAVRAWPGQLGGGWLRMLTWWRPLMAGRGLYQPVWQLEQARGATANQRRAVIGRNGTGNAAYMFGVACAHFEGILQLGIVAFIGMFTSDDQLKILAYLAGDTSSALMVYLPLLCYALAGALVGPIYIACCFTLYLNRRATLEAWDIELLLRQIEAPGAATRSGQPAAMLLAPLVLAVAALLLPAPPAAAQAAVSASAAASAPASAAAPASNAGKCKKLPALFPPVHLPPRDAGQQALHDELDAIYGSDELRGYDCELVWRLKDSKPEKKKDQDLDLPEPDLNALAGLVKALLIASAVILAAWLLYRYRGQLRFLLPRPQAFVATEVAGLDIREESLPDDVTGQVRRLWDQGERRGALALLYRATLSRLVLRHGLPVAHGATEGDCLRLAGLAVQRGQLDSACHAVAATVTGLWLNGAYAARWPDSGALGAACAAWDAQWGNGRDGRDGPGTPAEAGSAA